MKGQLSLILALILISTTALKSQWEQTEGPYGGIHVMKIAQRDSNLFAGTQCGLFTKTVTGKRWRPINYTQTGEFTFKGDSLFTSFYHGLGIVDLQDPNLTETPYPYSGSPFINSPTLAIKDTMMFITSGDGVYISHDWGRSTHLYNMGLPMDTVVYGTNTYYLLGVMDMLTTANYVYCATSKGVYKSDYSLTGWTEVLTASGNRQDWKLYNEGNNIFAHTRDSLFRSTDNGVTWQTLYTRQSGLRSFAAGNNQLYLAVDSFGVIRSADGGATWQPISAGIQNQNIVNVTYTGNSLYCGSYVGFYKWNGTTWQKQSSEGMICTYIQRVESTSANVFTSDWNKVYRLKSDDTWEDVRPNPYTLQWQLGELTVMNDTLFIPAFYNASYFGGDTARIYYSPDHGSTWHNMPAPFFQYAYGNFTALKLYGSVDSIFAFLGDELFYTTDFGQTWIDISPIGLQFCDEINQIIDFDGNLYMATCKTNLVMKYDKAFKIWVKDYGYPSFAEAKGFMQRDTNLFIYYPTEIYRRGKSAANWQNVSGGFSYQNLTSYANTANSLLMTNQSTLLSTFDEGNNWQDLRDNLHRQIWPYSVTVLNDTVYISTYQHGVFKRQVPSKPVSISEEINGVHAFTIYPNPATDYFRITSEKDGAGSFKIYDQSGKLMKEGGFKSGENIGIHQLNAGMYIVKLNQGKIFSEQKLMIK